MSELTPEEQAAADERREAAQVQHERGERLVKRLFMSEGECALRAANHTECSRAGIVDHQAIKRHGDALVAAMKPVLDEVQLTGAEVLELRQSMIQQAATAEEGIARREQFIESARRPIYGTRKQIEEKLAATRAAVLKAPALSKALATGDAGRSVQLHRGLYRRVQNGEPILRKPAIILK